jgi:uncharacterized protein involved in outer membrane biogenesis
MKVLKIVLIVAAVLVVLVMAGLFVFLKTFDANKFLPQITQQATQALGRDVRVGRAELGFSWVNGIGLQVKDIVIADDPKFADNPFLTVERVEIGVNVGALIFEHKIQLVQVVVVSPHVVIIRSKEGLVNAATLGVRPVVSATDPATQTPGGSAGSLPAFLVNDIKITSARVTYVDEMFTPRLALELAHMDINVRDLTLTGPFGVTIKAALFSDEQNVRVDAKMAVDILKQSLLIQGMNIEADLIKFNLSRLESELSMLKPLSLKKLGGVLKVSVSDAQISAQGLLRLKGQSVLEKGFVLSALLPVPFESIQMQADLDEKKINVKSFSLVVAGGAVNGGVLLTDYLSDLKASATFDAQRINAQKLVEGYKAPVNMSGLISAAGELNFSGKSPEDVLSSLSGQVKGELKDGVLESMNLLAFGLENIPMLPGLLDSVMADFSSETQDEIKKGITRFEMCKADAHITRGLMQLDAADIMTRDFSVHATGTVRLIEDLSIKAEIRMEKELSRRLNERVKELSYLQDDQGKIYLPMKLTGRVVKPVLMPDIEYLTKKLVIAAGGDQLQKALGGSPAAAEAVSAIFDLFKKK